MTLGELALFFRDRLLKARSRRSWSANWTRGRGSDSLPNAIFVGGAVRRPAERRETALAYAGTCLFEGVNMMRPRVDTPSWWRARRGWTRGRWRVPVG